MACAFDILFHMPMASPNHRQIDNPGIHKEQRSIPTNPGYAQQRITHSLSTIKKRIHVIVSRLICGLLIQQGEPNNDMFEIQDSQLKFTALLEFNIKIK